MTAKQKRRWADAAELRDSLFIGEPPRVAVAAAAAAAGQALPPTSPEAVADDFVHKGIACRGCGRFHTQVTRDTRSEASMHRVMLAYSPHKVFFCGQNCYTAWAGSRYGRVRHQESRIGDAAYACGPTAV